MYVNTDHLSDFPAIERIATVKNKIINSYLHVKSFSKYIKHKRI